MGDVCGKFICIDSEAKGVGVLGGGGTPMMTARCTHDGSAEHRQQHTLHT